MCSFMHMWWPFLDVWLRWWRCVFSPPFLHRPDSQPPGMIINLIIKHLLPTAPALSHSSETLRTPPQRESAREEESWRGREGHRRSQREGLERGEQFERVIITLLDSFTPARSCCFVWRQTACEVIWSQNKRNKEEGTIRCWEGFTARGPWLSLTSTSN